MASLEELVGYVNNLLLIEQYPDYCPNGMQIEGKADVQRIVAAVTASRAAVEHAVRVRADALLVHHGYFWRSEDAAIRGMKRARIKALLCNDISLLAYHLPLDGHSLLGNNAQLAERLGLTVDGRFGPSGVKNVAMLGRVDVPLPAGEFADRIMTSLGRVPLLLGDRSIIVRRVAWCTGGAQNYFEAAIAEGVDVFVTGEVSEPSYHLARESGVCYIAAGHHATERYGVQALGVHLAEQFSLDFEFFDEDNPV